MDSKASNIKASNPDFVEIVKKAYEKGLTEEQLTLEQLIADLKADLKNIVNI